MTAKADAAHRGSVTDEVRTSDLGLAAGVVPAARTRVEALLTAGVRAAGFVVLVGAVAVGVVGVAAGAGAVVVGSAAVAAVAVDEPAGDVDVVESPDGFALVQAASTAIMVPAAATRADTRPVAGIS